MVSSFPFARGLLPAICGVSILAVGPTIVVAQDAPPNPGMAGAANPAGSTNYQNAPVNTVLDLYEQLSGKHLIRDTNLSGIPPVSVNASGLSKDDTLKLIEATLLLNGVAIVPVDDHDAKVVTVGTNKNPRSEGVKLYANAVDLPDDDEVVSYYMPLNYISPQEALGIFTQDAPVHSYGAYVPAPTAQAIIVTESTAVVRQLIALKELIDVPPARVTTEFVQLERADAEKTADILNKMLGQGTGVAGGAAANPATGQGGVIVPASLGNNEPLSNEHNLITGTALITPDPRSNRLVITTRPVNLPFLKEMIDQLDQADIFMMPQRRELKYVLAQDILPALEEALAEGKDQQDQAKKDQTAAGTTSANGANGANGQRQNTQQPQSTAGAGSGGSGSVSAITPQLEAPAENNVPTVITLGNTRLLADNRSNSIIVFGSREVVSRVFDMIDQLDRKPLQVYLATVIGQLSVSEGEEFGIDILNKFQRIGSGGLASSNVNTTTALGTGGTASVPEPNTLLSSTGFPLLAGLNLYGMIGSTLDAYVRALETTDRFKIISRPSVYTTNNKLAVIASGSQVPVPSSTTSGFTGTDSQLATTSSIAYEDVLLQLDIIPLINANHDVTLKIRQTNNSLGKNQDISGNLVPIINTQEINTEVTVPDKSTVVIGGLISDTTTRDTSGIPWLSDIPILKYLFSDTSKTKDRTELIIMIQPSVVENDADQLAVNEAEKQRTILGREAVDSALTSPSSVPPQPSAIPTALPTSNGSTKTTIHTTTYNSKTGNSNSTTQVILNPNPAAPAGVAPAPPHSMVPGLSSPAPDVSNGQLPHNQQTNPPPSQ